jgi:hypothetical protein
LRVQLPHTVNLNGKNTCNKARFQLAGSTAAHGEFEWKKTPVIRPGFNLRVELPQTAKFDQNER